MFKSVVIWLCLFSSTALLAHPFHTSLTEIEYNADQQILEIAIRLSPGDLEDALSAFFGSSVVLDGSSDNDSVIFAYIKQKLAVYPADSKAGDDPHSLSLQWVGKQLDIKSIWIFLTAPTAEQVIKLDNRLLLTLNAQQMNTLSVIRQGKKSSHQLTRNNTSLVINFNNPDE